MSEELGSEQGTEREEQAPEASTEVVAGAMAEGDLAAVRELALRANPDVVPELVGGGSVAEIVASVEPARAAYRRVVEAAAPAVPAVPTVPAGNAPPVAIDPDLLPPAEKIRRGLAGR